MTDNTNNSTTATSRKTQQNSKADLENQVEILKAQVAALMQQLTAQQQLQATTPIFAMPTNEVAVVYCSDSLGHASISNMELNFTRYGEEFVMSRTQFDELVGKYRSWFDRGILTVASKYVDVAAAKGLKTDKEVYLTPAKLESIGRMSASEFEALWNSLETKVERESVVSYFKRKFIEGDEAFRDRTKIDLINRLTDGSFTREQEELSGRYKINKTEIRLERD